MDVPSHVPCTERTLNVDLCNSDGFPWASRPSRSGSASGTAYDGVMVACDTIPDGV